MITIDSIKKEIRDESKNGLLAFLSDQVSSGAFGTYIEALSHYIEENDIEYDKVSGMLNQTLKEILYTEASDLKMLKKSERINSLTQFTD